MIKVVIIGSGNLASHLIHEFQKSNRIHLVQVYNRNIDKIQYLKNQVAITSKIADLKDADIYILAISDNAISEFSKKLVLKNKLVVHTSGGLHLNNLKSDSDKGVFYPLQTFSKNKKVEFSSIPICIEANEQKDIILLEKLAKSISTKCYSINSKQRKSLHVSAVFVNNFVNHLYHIGNEICKEQNIPFELLLPLIEETATKIQSLPPIDAQTGPAKRNDTKTIEEHLALLNANQQNIYKLLTNSITTTYGKKL